MDKAIGQQRSTTRKCVPGRSFYRRMKMKNTRILSPRSCMVAVAVAWSIAPVGIGDGLALCSSAQAQDHTVPAAPLPATEALRAALRGVLEQQQQLAITIGSREAQEITSQGLAQLEALTSDDLAVFQGLEVHISLLRSKTEALHQGVEPLQAQLGRPIADIANLTPWAAQPASSHAPTTLTNADYGIICNVNPTGWPLFGPNRALTEVVQGAEVLLGVSEGVLFIAEGVRDVAQDACNLVVVAACFGGNPQSAACAVTDLIYIGVKIVDGLLHVAFKVLTFCDDDIDSAEIEGAYERAGDIFALNQDIQSELAAHDTNIDEDLAAHDANIDADLVTHDAEIKARLDDIEAKLDALQKVEVSVIELQAKQRFLLAAKESGQPVDITLLGVAVSNGRGGRNPILFEDVPAEVTPTGSTGLFEVALNLPPKLERAKIFQFRVKDAHFDDGGNLIQEHFGTVIFHRTASTGHD